MECPNGCPMPMESQTVERIFHRIDGESVVVTGLVLDVCPECGQESMSFKTGEALEKILQGDVSPAGEFSAQLYRVAV